MRRCPQCDTLYPDNVSHCGKDGQPLAAAEQKLMEADPADVHAIDSVRKKDSAALQPAGTYDEQGLPRLGAVLGSYRLLDILGEGGMGRVYLSEHVRLGRKVALKIPRPEFAANPRAVKRFFGEARAVNQICHENIVEITDFIEEGQEKYYIMELLQGRTFASLQHKEGVLPLGRSLGILVQVCKALGAVHNAGIVHRDLKPDNVFLTERSGQKDFVKLLDFGLAKLTDPNSQSLSQTDAGSVLGTPEYMSPEQAGGRQIDYRADIYSIGVILYETITGHKPFTASSFIEMLVKHVTVTPGKPSKIKNLPHAIPKALEELTLACLQKEPENRPPSSIAIAEKLAEIAENESLTLEAFAPVTDGPGPSGRRIAAAAAVVLLAFGGWYAANYQQSGGPVVEEAQAEALETPPKAPTVQVTFKSTPTGAEIFREGSEQPLGLTPLSIDLDRTSSAARFEFRLRGHKTITQEVVPAQNSTVAVALANARPPLRPQPKPKAKPGPHVVAKRPPTKSIAATASPVAATAKSRPAADKSGVIDPFADE